MSPTAHARPYTAACKDPWQCTRKHCKQRTSFTSFGLAQHNCTSCPSEHGAASLESFAGSTINRACSSLPMQCSEPDLVWADAPLCLKAGCCVGLHSCHQRVGLSILLGRTQQLQAGAQQLEVVLQGKRWRAFKSQLESVLQGLRWRRSNSRRNSCEWWSCKTRCEIV